MNEQIEQIMNDFAKQIIDVCIEEVKKTPTTSAYTTFDLDIVEHTIAKSVSQLEKLLK